MQPMRVTSFSAVELARQCVSGFLNSGIGGQYILEFEEDTPGNTSIMPESVGSGHGLGLRIVRQIAKAHKGSVRFSQTVPRGLTVRAVIPAS